MTWADQVKLLTWPRSAVEQVRTLWQPRMEGYEQAIEDIDLVLSLMD